MPEPYELTPGAVDIPDPQVFDAIVATDATSPTDDVFVTIPDFDDPESGQHWRHGPCTWQPRTDGKGVYFPKRGDTCTVVVPAGSSPVISVWRNTASEPDVSSAGSVGMIIAGEDPLTVRPDHHDHYIWVTSVVPINAIENDLLVKTK